MTETERNTGIATLIGKPVVEASGFSTNRDIRKVGPKLLLESFESVWHLFLQEKVTGFVHDSNEHLFGMQVDPAIVLGVDLRESHDTPPGFCYKWLG